MNKQCLLTNTAVTIVQKIKSWLLKSQGDEKDCHDDTQSQKNDVGNCQDDPQCRNNKNGENCHNGPLIIVGKSGLMAMKSCYNFLYDFLRCETILQVET